MFLLQELLNLNQRVCWAWIQIILERHFCDICHNINVITVWHKKRVSLGEESSTQRSCKPLYHTGMRQQILDMYQKLFSWQSTMSRFLLFEAAITVLLQSSYLYYFFQFIVTSWDGLFCQLNLLSTIQAARMLWLTAGGNNAYAWEHSICRNMVMVELPLPMASYLVYWIRRKSSQWCDETMLKQRVKSAEKDVLMKKLQMLLGNCFTSNRKHKWKAVNISSLQLSKAQM